MKRKSFDELTFADDGMFQKVMQNAELSAELVERLLGVRVKQVEYPELEKAIEPYYTSKGVRLAPLHFPQHLRRRKLREFG